MMKRIISPELESDKLNHEGPFYICDNCAQLLTKEHYEKGSCPNCEFNHNQCRWTTYAVSEETALWWLANTEGWMKTIEDIGVDLIIDEQRRERWKALVTDHSPIWTQFFERKPSSSP